MCVALWAFGGAKLPGANAIQRLVIASLRRMRILVQFHLRPKFSFLWKVALTDLANTRSALARLYRYASFLTHLAARTPARSGAGRVKFFKKNP